MKAAKKRMKSPKLQEAKREKEDSPNFLLKLYQILETAEFEEIIHWNDNGKYFIVQNLHGFTEQVLPKFYKHSNYSSFVRQLNMYDFHKKRDIDKGHVFFHKLFVKGKRDLIKTIKRKNKKDLQINCNNDQALVEYCNDELASKKTTKTNLEKALNHLVKSLEDSNDKQNELENKVEKLCKQNEDFLLQNEQMLQDIVSKTDYNKKLEIVVCYFLEMKMKKPSLKGNDSKNVLISNENINNDLMKVNDNDTFQNIIPKNNNLINSDSFNGFIEKYVARKNPSRHFLQSKTDLPMLLTNGEELNPVNFINNPTSSNNNPSNSFILNNKNTNSIPLSSPMHSPKGNVGLSSIHFSPNRQNALQMRKRSIDSAVSMQLDDEFFKNSAMNQIMSKHNQDLHNNNNNDPNMSFQSINSRHLFDMHFPLDDDDQNVIGGDKKDNNCGFFEYDNLSS